jgi:2-haloacid dehalogenase
MLRAVVKNAGLGGMFTHVISVDEVKIYKPRAAAYQLAVRKLGVNRKDVAFVSSNF